MSKLWVVIPAAGKSQRFIDAGYLTPKPLLRLEAPDGKIGPMIEFIKDTVPKGLEIIEILHLEKTVGQADTVYQGIKDLPSDDSCLILDCDTLLQTIDIQKLISLLGIYDMSLLVAETFDPNASRVDQIPFPTRFVEKEPISQFGIIGARAFKDIGFLTLALKRTLDRCAIRSTEPYLSTAINHYPGTKFAHLITEYVDLGTPQRIKEAGWEIV